MQYSFPNPVFYVVCLSIFMGWLGRPLSAQQVSRAYDPFTIVIDPGHGGKDPGAVGKVYYEKDLALKIAKSLADSIKAFDSTIQVILTRRTDTFIELYQRATIAQEAKGDFFISIHCNALKYKDRQGVETYILGINEGQENYETIIKENEAMLFEKNYQEIYGGFDPSTPEGFIYFKLIKNVFRNESMLMAHAMQKAFTEEYNRVDRGVKQAPFIVLYMAGMPAVLSEVGFISNEEEEQYIASPKGQQEITSALMTGIRTYMASLNN